VCRAAALGAALAAGVAHGQSVVVVSSSGFAAQDVMPAVDFYRNLLGPLNPNVAGSFASGRREINWDGVPDALSAPNNLPADFFNVNSPRGVVFSTPGTGLQVSGNPASGAPPDFSNIDPAYSGFFAAFSAPRLFTSIGSNVVDVNFFVSGSSTPALTRGFGAVFSDVDLANTTSISFFDASNALLLTRFVPALDGDESFLFLGAVFSSAVVSRVRITNGNQILMPGNTQTDLVVMDDFIYGEPIAAVPEPESFTLLLAGLGVLAAVLRRRRSGDGRAADR